MAKLLRLLVWVAVFCVIVFTFHAASSLELPRARFWIQTTVTLVLEVLGIGFLVALGDVVIVPTEERENYEGSLVVVILFIIVALAMTGAFPMATFSYGLFDFGFYAIGAVGAGFLSLFVAPLFLPYHWW